MNISPAYSAHVAVLDELIARAEASCERHRRAAAEPDLKPSVAHGRRQALRQVEIALSRLRARRLAACSVDRNSRD
jgi:hypothetical protein